MKWFRLTFSLGNVVAAAKFSLFYLVLIVLGLTTMSFTDPENNRANGFYSDSTQLASLAKEVDVQLNPQAIPFVEAYVQKQGEELEKMKTWAKHYFDLYDQILGEYGVPKEMKYLSVIESHLVPGLVSWAGAVGPWQIMPDEAKRFGLRRGAGVDERKDFAKSTAAAAQLMRELYSKFGDWLLVVAAYNCGAGGVRKAIRKAGSRDFWALQDYLPEETRNHVKKFIGTHYIFEGGGGLTTLTAAETEAMRFEPAPLMSQNVENQSNTEIQSVAGKYSSVLNIAGQQPRLSYR